VRLPVLPCLPESNLLLLFRSELEKRSKSIHARTFMSEHAEEKVRAGSFALISVGIIFHASFISQILADIHADTL